MQPRVLVVEDEAALLTLLRYNLEKEGFAVAEARDGEEALLHLKEETPDAVLLDWMLPRVSGLELCWPNSPQLCLARSADHHADGARRRDRPRARPR